METKSEHVTFKIGSVSVFSSGFVFHFSVRTDVPPRKLCDHTLKKARNEERDPEDLYLQIGVGFSDGRRASAGVEWVRVRPDDLAGRDIPERYPPDPEKDLLLKLGGVEDGECSFSGTGWTWPLPPPGKVTFWLGWPGAGLNISPVSAEASIILDAAERVRGEG